MTTDRYHVTVLSNFIRGWDKYARRYSKAAIPESTFPDRFYVLRRDDLGVGVDKASRLLARTGLDGDRLLVLRTDVSPGELGPNERTGLGEVLARDHIDVHGLYLLGEGGALQPISVEDAAARSLACFHPERRAFAALRPRTVSLLPVGRGCQAACDFCFSTASISTETRGRLADPARVERALAEGRRRGAERAVITGGGEPGLLPDDRLLALVRACARHFPKVVLITNGHAIAHRADAERLDFLERLAAAGLSVLAVSRHHHDPAANAAIMHLDTRSDAIAATFSAHRARLAGLSMRWVCVMRRGGVEDAASLRAYVDWAARSGVDEVCFKELYVSTSVESEYHATAANEWSRLHQVPLRLVLDAARDHGWPRLAALPWGAPIFAADVGGVTMRVAAYTEPSVYWELHNGTCRSWNLLADGRCLASLEDRRSEVPLD